MQEPRSTVEIDAVAFAASIRLSELAQDGTAEPVLRDLNSQARTGTETKKKLPVQLTTSKVGNRTG